VDQAIVELGIKVSAAVPNNNETKICVNRFEQSGEDNAAGGDSVKNQRINIVGTKDPSEIGPSKGTDPMFSDGDLTLFGGDDRWDLPEWFLK
jgi:hypothetical protein